MFGKHHITKMVDHMKDVYMSVAKTSTIKKAKITGLHSNSSGCEDVAVEVVWSSCNLASPERSNTICNYFVQGENVMSFPPIPVSKNMLLRQTTESGRLTACVMTSEKDKDAEHMTVVEKDGSMTTYDLTAADKHGKVYADEEFSCLEWSPDEDILAYIAEKKRSTPSSFFTPLKSEDEDCRGQEFLYRDDWGEQLKGKHESVVCFLNIKTREIKCFELPEKMCPGQLVWDRSGCGVFGVAFVSKPYRLGLIYCHNRESRLFHMDMEGSFNVITEGCSNIRSPRVSPDGGSIAFLRTRVGGPHAQCSQFCLLSWPSKQERVIIDVVQQSSLTEDKHKFMGIFSFSGLPRRCWLKDSARIVFSSIKYNKIVTYVINTASGTLRELPHLWSHHVMDVYEDWLLVNFSSLTHPNQILMGLLPSSGNERSIKFSEVTVAHELPEIPKHFFSEWMFVNDIPHPNQKYSEIPISVLYYGPSSRDEDAAKRPLICWPHGGPHSSVSNLYNMAATFFVRLGYSVVFPNYRGSLGFGQDGIEALPGHCGQVDVSDVHMATEKCLKRYPDVLDSSQVFLFGGSHGGFLVTHLIAQKPDFYKGVATRNPVTDLFTMAGTTEIQEWPYVESGLPYKHGQVPNEEALSRMWAVSPIRFIDAIRAPVLLLVGKNDARAPPSQSLNFYKMLLARGIETQLLLYDDCHPLNKVEVEADVLINSALWFEKIRSSL